MRTIRPLRDYILLRRTKAESTSAGGLFIPENAKRKSGWGEILAVGQGLPIEGSAELRPVNPDLKPGTVVRFRDIAGVEIELDDEEGLVMIREDDVEAIRE